ncbi:MAG: TonB-dependent receptor [Henriciella sp.]|jgi:iron complex outermembrane receptor protein
MKLRFLPLLCLTVGAASAYAQDAEAPLIADTVLVTIPGSDRGADELIGNATSIDREELLENLEASLGNTLDRQPGVSTTFFGQGASRPVLRGLGAERVQVLTNGIGVIDASAASPDHQVSADGIDATKIEILRGPAALAYGGQAIGGVVNVIDGLIAEELPAEPFSADLFSAYNSVNEGTELAGKAQFVNGPFMFSLSASQRDFGDYEIPGGSESAALIAAEEAEGEEHEEEEGGEGVLENSFVDTQTFSAGLSWVGDTSFLGVSVRQQTSEYGLPGHGHGHEEHEDEDHEDEDEDHDEEEHDEEEESPFIDLEQTRVEIRGGAELGETGLTSVRGSLVFVDYEHTEFEAPGEAGTVYETDGFEARFEAGTSFGELNGAIGVQLLDKELLAVGEEAFITPTTTESVAAFLYQTREWDNGFGIEFGSRLERVELDNTLNGEAGFDLVSGSFGAHRHFEGGWFFGAQASYSERAPSESELFANGPHLATEQFEIGNRFLDKEKGLNLESTARWSNDTLSIGANVFVTEFTDFIYLTPDGRELDELPVFVFNQEDASFVGGEIYGEAVIDGPLSAEWTFDASVDFVEAELDGGGNVPFIPPVTLNAGASAEWGAWEIGGDVTFAGDQDDPGAGQFATDGYTVLNLRGEVDLSDFGFGADGTEAFIEARNVTDEEVRYATSVLKDVAPAAGQNFRVGLRVAF